MDRDADAELKPIDVQVRRVGQQSVKPCLVPFKVLFASFRWIHG